MNYLKNTLPVWGVLLLLFAVSTSSAFAYSFGPPDEKTGAPNESTCAQAGCHAGNDLNVSGGSLMLTVPETYIPNEVYTIVVNLSREGQSRWGFEMTALGADGARAGSFAADDAGNTKLSEAGGKQYIKQTSIGTGQGTNDTHSWKFQWTAPNADIGPITFYAAGNAANLDFFTTGDYIYTTQSESAPVVGGVSLEIVGDDALSTTDAVEGVSYTLKVTNTGNVTDTVSLEASAEVGIEGSVLGTLSDSERSIQLEAGASKEVTLRVAGDAFTKSGDYPITVTATSGTDSTMTAEVTATTTIEIPPTVAGVSLEIVGDDTLSTMDAVEGVNYTLKVTNTGNMQDTITLEASAEVGIEGSVLGTLSENSIELEAGTSAEVTLTVSGDQLTTHGDYTIIVTATSGTNNMITAEIITITVIEMPPPPPTPWDVNGDGTVNIQDLVLVAGQFGQTGASLKEDINGDGIVNVLDLVIVSSHFGEDTSN